MKSISRTLAIMLVAVMFLTSLSGCTKAQRDKPTNTTIENSETQPTSSVSYNEKYFINIEESDKGKISASTSMTAAGTLVSVAVSPKSGYLSSGITVIKKGNKVSEPISGKNGAYAFVMPSGDVTIKASYQKKLTPTMAKVSASSVIKSSSALAALTNTNLFLGATATANSELNPDSYGIANAFDGGITAGDSRWVTSIGEGAPNPAIVGITLAAPASIQSIVIFERYYGGDPNSRGRVTHFSVFTIDDQGARVEVVNNLEASAIADGDITTHRINFTAAVTSAKFEIQFTLHQKGLSEGANIIQIEGFAEEQSEPIPEPDPDAPKDTKDFAVGANMVASSEMPPAYSATMATLPYDVNYKTENRWGAPTSGEDVTAEITFVEPALISFVKIVQYEGPKPTGWGTGKRIETIKVELADDGEPYTVVASGAPVALDATGLPYVPSGMLKTLETPMRAVRMRVTMTPNANGKMEGLNIKAIESYGVVYTAETEPRSPELKKVLNVAYSKNAAAYTGESWSSFTTSLLSTRAIYSAGNSASETQIVSAINTLSDSIHALKKKVLNPQRIKVAFVGDSITYGHFLPDPPSQCFSAKMQEKLGKEVYEIKNFAISGRTLTNTNDLPYMNEPLYKNSLAYSPDVVVIMLGTNDSKPKYDISEAQYAADARKLINSYKLLDSQPVIFFNTAPTAILSLGGGSDVISPEGVAKVAGWQRTIASEIPGIYQMDIFEQTAGFTAEDYRANDGVHPSEQGHIKLADIMINNFNTTKGTLVLSNRLNLLKFKDYREDGYTADAWKAFDDARKTLTDSINSDTSTADEIIAAMSTFNSAFTLLSNSIDNTKIRVACIGDSITRGDGGGQYIYPTYLQTQLNKQEANRFIVKNFGENGMMASDRQGCGLTDPNTSGGMYPHYDKYTASLAFLPNVVTIKLGTNDAKYVGENAPKFKDDMKKIIGTYQALPSKPQIIIITSAWAQVTAGALTQGWADAINKTMVPLQRELAKELNLPLIDINKYTKYQYDNGAFNPPSDGIHGNYQAISEGVWKGLMGDGLLADGTSYVQNAPTATFNKSYLSAIIEIGKGYVETAYTPESWASYSAKLTAAKSVFGNASATVNEIISARTELAAAQIALVTA